MKRYAGIIVCLALAAGCTTSHQSRMSMSTDRDSAYGSAGASVQSESSSSSSQGPISTTDSEAIEPHAVTPPPGDVEIQNEIDLQRKDQGILPNDSDQGAVGTPGAAIQSESESKRSDKV